jgi:hypothetical protein
MRYAVRRDRTGSEHVDAEVVVISFETGHYYCLNSTATLVWSLLGSGSRGADEVGGALAGLYERPSEPVRADVRELLAALEGEGLLESLHDSSGATVEAEPAVARPPGPYVKPAFEKFGTLEQLMLAGE